MIYLTQNIKIYISVIKKVFFIDKNLANVFFNELTTLKKNDIKFVDGSGAKVYEKMIQF